MAEQLRVGDREYTIYRLDAVYKTHPNAHKLPFCLKILLENLVRRVDGQIVTQQDVEALANWNPRAKPDREIAFMPARVLLQDFTGVPAIVDLAAMRDAMVALGGDPKRINPLLPAELVIDHSVQVDDFGSSLSFKTNAEIEYRRNRERYMFLRWGQTAFNNFRVVPPQTGIVHQVNLEYLARVVFVDSNSRAYPDTLVGTDSHTTMINGLGVLGWGVGGIEAEAAMLGQPVSMLIPEVVGFKLSGKLPEGATATDLVLVVTQMLRTKGVVGKFVEFYGPGLAELPLADRATISNMAPEYGATCGIFPIDDETLRFLRFTGRNEEQVRLVEAYAKEQGMFRTANSPDPVYSDTLDLDLGTVVPSLAGPSRPQDRVALTDVKSSFAAALPGLLARASKDPAPVDARATVTIDNKPHELHHGSVVIAAITSCTNTSNPSVMIAAGLVAKKAVERGLATKPWVKTSLAPGSKVVTDYLIDAGVMRPLEQLGFYLAGYGCTTCIAEGTPVLLANGTTRRIEQLPEGGGAVLFGPTSANSLGMAAQEEKMEQGVRECVSLVLQDGRRLVCTPDHELLCADGRWLRADQLIPGEDRVVVGLEAPLDEPGIDEVGYSLRAGDMTFTMDTPQHRLRTLAFARIVGHLLSDGSISVSGQGRMNVGQAVDREVVLNDVELVTGIRPVAKQYDERKWSIVLPRVLTQAIISLSGVRVGKRIHQAATLPTFVLEESCPVAVVREFLGGLFGADGHAPVLRRYGRSEEEANLIPPAFSQTAKPEHVDYLVAVMHDLIRLLSRCGVETDGARLYQYPTRRSASSYPSAQDGESRIEVRLELPDGLSFAERVGFRYCTDKALRTGAAAVYWRMVDGINRQRLWMANRVTALREEKYELSFSQIRGMAATELMEQETPVFAHYSLLKGHDRFSRLPNGDGRKFHPLHRESCGFPSPVELFKQLGVREWFARLQTRQTTDYSKRYCVEKESLEVPAFALQVIDRRPAGRRRVYDLSVSNLHAFVAGTACVHNCIGNSGPLPEPVSKGIKDGRLVAASVLSGNRNFEGRVHGEVRANYLASPPLVVAYALAGRIDIDLQNEPLGTSKDGQPVYLRDVWPTQQEVRDAISKSVRSEMFLKEYSEVFTGDEEWRGLPSPTGDLYTWDEKSTYVKHPPYFAGMGKEPGKVEDIRNARVLCLLGDSITTDHISPAGAIKPDSPAGKYLIEHGVHQPDFNSYGSRRGNHEVMVRGTFANVRLKNLLAPGTEGGFTRHLPDGEEMSIYDASEKYHAEGVPLIILAGKEYGSGSSRDWAAKGPCLLGVRAVLAESFERIHRSNLVGMGILPLQFRQGETAAGLGLTGEETYDLEGIASLIASGKVFGKEITIHAKSGSGTKTFQALVRIDTPQEVKYYQHGGILQFVLRQLVNA